MRNISFICLGSSHLCALYISVAVISLKSVDSFVSYFFFHCKIIHLKKIQRQCFLATLHGFLSACKVLCWVLVVNLRNLIFPFILYFVVCMLSRFRCVQLFAALWTVAHQVPLPMGFSRQEYWSGLPCPPPVGLPKPGIEPASFMSPVLADGFFTTIATSEALLTFSHY